MCVETCPAHLFVMNETVAVREEEHCIECGHCIAICPEDAITHARLDAMEFELIDERKEISSEHMMHFLRSRRSCRVYLDREVPRDVVEKLILAGRYAPTANNSQDVAFTVVQDPARVKKIATMAAEFFGQTVEMLENSPDPISPSIQKQMRGMRLIYEYSLQGKDRVIRGAPMFIVVHAPESIASQANCHYALLQMVLIAEALGLGNCINGYMVAAAEYVPEIRAELGVPEGNKVYGCMTLGYAKHRFRKIPPRREAAVQWR
jgi:nitroreductase